MNTTRHPDTDARPATITVSVPLSITLDPGEWTQEYGIAGTPAIRQDVRDHIANTVQGALYAAGIESVTVKVRR